MFDKTQMILMKHFKQLHIAVELCEFSEFLFSFPNNKNLKFTVKNADVISAEHKRCFKYLYILRIF